jgi:hypothetical protein
VGPTGLPYANEESIREHISRLMGRELGHLLLNTPRAFKTELTEDPRERLTHHRVTVRVLLNPEEEGN